MAFRVITERAEDCYRALGIIHQRYKMVPGRFKDYISTPKRNGYKSLHTTVIHNENARIEIQIRSKEMHHDSEFGLAARSEEHTSELQSLMRISNAVFCLKKKKKIKAQYTYQQT